MNKVKKGSVTNFEREQKKKLWAKGRRKLVIRNKKK